MTKTWKTLKEDIEHVLKTGEGWTKEISEWVANDISVTLTNKFKPRNGERKGNLRVSNLGTPCERKLWYIVNCSSDAEPLSASTLNKFVFGDLTESYLLGLCKAAGHKVTGLQDTMDVRGITGHRDCVIDGMLFDVKSASSYSFKKFADGRLRQDDAFGYISQLSSYLYASQDDDSVIYKDKAGFLVMDKQLGHICVDIHELSEEIKNKPEEVDRKKKVTKYKNPPDRAYEDKPYGKSGNMTLDKNCSYCDFKFKCWPEVRTFLYSSGPVYLTHVEREPSDKVYEVK